MWIKRRRERYGMLALLVLSGTAYGGEDISPALQRAFGQKLAVRWLFGDVRSQGLHSDIYAFESRRCALECLRRHYVSGGIKTVEKEMQLSFTYARQWVTLRVDNHRGELTAGYIVVSRLPESKQVPSLPFGPVSGKKLLDVESRDANARHRTLLIQVKDSVAWQNMMTDAIRRGFSVVMADNIRRLVILRQGNEELVMQSVSEQGIWTVMVNYHQGVR